MNSQYFIGVDPGASGAIAVYDSLTDELISAVDLPTLNIKVGKSVKRRLDKAYLANEVHFLSQMYPFCTVIIEEVSAMPGQGVSSTFAFGANFGALEQCFVDHGFKTVLVRPATWKRAMKLTAEKDYSRLVASRTFPASSHLWMRKKDDGRAEAALIAFYGSTLNEKVLG